MAHTLFDRGDVFRIPGTEKVGVVISDVFVIIVGTTDPIRSNLTAESYPQRMVHIPNEEVKDLPFGTQCIIKGIKATLFFVAL